MKRILLPILTIGVLLLSACAAPSAPTTSPTTTTTTQTTTTTTTTTPPNEEEQTPSCLLELERSHWGRGIGYLNIGGITVSERVLLYIEGSARNIGSQTLTSVICVMKCWSGGTLVKSEEYVVGITVEEANFTQYYQVLPGNAFDFDIDTDDDPSVDNVTIEFKDSSGNIIPHIVK